MTPCFGAHQKRVEAHVETKDKKIVLVIDNVKVSEIKQIMEFIAKLRAKEGYTGVVAELREKKTL